MYVFEDATKNISGVSYCHASLVISIINDLLNVYSKIKANKYPHEIMPVVSKINSDLKHHLSNIEYTDILGITTFFNSRFITFVFYDQACAELIKEIIISSVSLIYNLEFEYQIQEDTIIEDDTPKEFSIWNSFNLNISHFKPRRTAASHAIDEVHSYLQDDVIP